MTALVEFVAHQRLIGDVSNSLTSNEKSIVELVLIASTHKADIGSII